MEATSLKYLPINEDGTLDISNPKKYFTEKTKIVCVIHQSNVFGTVNPIQEIVQYLELDLPFQIHWTGGSHRLFLFFL